MKSGDANCTLGLLLITMGLKSNTTERTYPLENKGICNEKENVNCGFIKKLICTFTLGKNSAYEHPCTSSIAGSGASQPGGGVIYSTTERLIELDGSINANAYMTAKPGEGGGSGGTISLSARYNMFNIFNLIYHYSNLSYFNNYCIENF